MVGLLCPELSNTGKLWNASQSKNHFHFPFHFPSSCADSHGHQSIILTFTFRDIMDSLFAKADAIKPFVKRRKSAYNSSKNHNPSSSAKDANADHTAQSIAKRTSVPKSLLSAPLEPSSGSIPEYSHVASKKLRSKLQRQSVHNARAKALVDDSADLLLVADAGKMEVEDTMDRTWRTGQDEISDAAGQEAARGRKELRLDGGPYMMRYTRNGRCVSLFMPLYSV